MTPEPARTPAGQNLYVWLTAFFVACLLIADIIGIKLFRLPFPGTLEISLGFTTLTAVEHTCGMLTFPVTFLLTDLINEYYGSRAARRVTYIGLVMALFVFGVINLAQAMPRLDRSYNVPEEAFNAVFGSAKIMYLASVSAYLVGQMCDIFLFKVIKRWTGDRLLWLRATGSTIVSQTLDSFVVSYLAFGLGRTLTDQPAAPFEEVLKIAATGYVLKFCLGIAITPLIYAGRSLMHRGFGLTPHPPE